MSISSVSNNVSPIYLQQNHQHVQKEVSERSEPASEERTESASAERAEQAKNVANNKVDRYA